MFLFKSDISWVECIYPKCIYSKRIEVYVEYLFINFRTIDFNINWNITYVGTFKRGFLKIDIPTFELLKIM